jgi:hypothetical protein
LNGTHEFLACADDCESTGRNYRYYREVGLEVNIEKPKYMPVSQHQNAGQNWDIKIANRSFENVSQLRYLGTTVTSQNFIQKEFKRRLDFGNACCHSGQNLLSSHLLSKM